VSILSLYISLIGIYLLNTRVWDLKEIFELSADSARNIIYEVLDRISSIRLFINYHKTVVLSIFINLRQL